MATSCCNTILTCLGLFGLGSVVVAGEPAADDRKSLKSQPVVWKANTDSSRPTESADEKSPRRSRKGPTLAATARPVRFFHAKSDADSAAGSRKLRLDCTSLIDRVSPLSLLPLVRAHRETLNDFKSAESQVDQLDQPVAMEYLKWRRSNLDLLNTIVESEKEATHAVITVLERRIKRGPIDDVERDELRIHLLDAENRLKVLELLTK